jgi:hypothetical protein
MPLKLFPKREEIPEAHRASAVELKDGQFAIAEEEDTTGLQNTIKATRKERDDAIAAKASAESKAADTQRQLDARIASTGDVDKKISDLLTKWEADKNAAVQAAKDEAQKRIDELSGFRNKRLVEDELKKAFRAAEGREDLEDDVVALTRGDFKLVDDKLVNVDASGQVTTVSPEQFYKNLKAKRGMFYKGTQADGGGAPGGGGAPAGGLDTKPPTQWTSEERANFLQQHGQGEYQKRLDAEVLQKSIAAAKPKAA